jgi:hypothetical protein
MNNKSQEQLSEEQEAFQIEVINLNRCKCAGLDICIGEGCGACAP